MNVRIERYALIGGGLAYDAYVPETEVPPHVMATNPMRHGLTGVPGWFVRFETAVLPEALLAMPGGMDKYDAVVAFGKRAGAIALGLARCVYPELKAPYYSGTTLPDLWVTGLLPRALETRGTETVPFYPYPGV